MLQAQLNGSYTIDAGAPASATNFQSFNALAASLAANGISGHVVVDVDADSGPYNEQVVFTTVTGSGPTATITINGNGNSIQATTTTTDRHVLRLANVTYFTVKYLNVAAVNATPTTNFMGVHVFGSCSNVIVENVSVDMTGITSTLAGGIVVSGSTTSILTAGTFSNITVRNNTTTGGGYGVSFMGSASTGIEIHGNTIHDFSSNGIYSRGTNGIMIYSNTISKGAGNTSLTNGIQLAQSDNANGAVHSNRISLPQAASSFVGIQIFGGTGHKVYNNLIHGINAQSGDIEGIRVRAGAPQVYFNTVIFDHNQPTSGSLRAFTENLSNTLTVLRNNIFYITQPSADAAIYEMGSTSNIMTALNSNNNVFYNPSGSIAVRGTATYSTLAAWQAASGQDAASLVSNPFFQAGTGIPTSAILNNWALAGTGITTDITGAARSVTPDPGAYEFGPAALDAALTAYQNPSLPFCGNTLNVQFELTNNGATLLNSAVINWSINGVPQVPFNWTGPALASGASAIVTVGTASLTPNTSYQFEATVSAPNGGSDSYALNNTFASPGFRSGMSGAYTIHAGNPASTTNYTSFQAIANDLATYGVCGPVTITVSGGPYTEQAVFSAIPGTSSTNTVTLNGNGQTLQFNATTATSHILRLDGVEYMTVENLTVKTLHATNGWGIHITNNASNLVIRNNTIDMSAGHNTTFSTGSMIGILVSGTTSYLNSGSLSTGLQIEGNTVQGGYIGIQITGTNLANKATNINIIDNDVEDYYMQGIQVTWGDQVRIADNRISRPNRTTSGGDSTGPSGINMNTGGSNYEIDKNRIFNIAGNMTGDMANKNHWGIKIGGNATNPTSGTVSNNLVYNFNNNWSQYGIDFAGTASQVNIIHNTIVLDQANSTATGSGFQTATIRLSSTSVQNDVVIKNNILYNTRGGAGLEKNILRIDAAGTTPEADYNVYYLNVPAGTQHLVRRTTSTTYTTLASWQGASSQDAHTVEANPLFVNPAAADYMPANNLIDGTVLATSNVGVSDDILHVTRSANPDPGAFEFAVAQGPLPVQLVTFSGQRAGNANRLRWVTEGEANNRGFHIERSPDGSQFTTIGFVPSQAPGGNTASKLSYSFSDNAPPGARQYYRLRQEDFDGSSKWSATILLKGDGLTNLQIGGVYPNPAQDLLQLSIDAPASEMVSIQLLDASGRLLREIRKAVDQGTNTVPLNLSGIPAGLYFVRLHCGANCNESSLQFFKK